MNITAKQIERSNIIFVVPPGLDAPDAGRLFPLYTSEQTKGAAFADTPSMATRVFEFSAMGLQWVFEPTRIHLEERKSRTPAESRLGLEFMRVFSSLYPSTKPTAYGFNFDVIYRMDNVIPVADVMSSFVKPESLENIKDFGWQYSLMKNKGRETETYFFKVVSPIEFSVHANFHKNNAEIGKAEELQALFEKSYIAADEGLSHMNF